MAVSDRAAKALAMVWLFLLGGVTSFLALYWLLNKD